MSNAAGVPMTSLPFSEGRLVAVRSGPGFERVKKETKRNALLFLYATVYVLLSVIYVYYTSSVWAYIGLDLDINPVKVAISIAVLFGFIIITPTKWSARAFFLNVMLTAYLLPSLVLYGFSDRPNSAAVMIWLTISIVYVVSGAPVPRFKIFSIGPKEIALFLLVLSSVLVVLFYAVGGFRNFNLDFSRVYEFRALAAETVPGIFGYLSLLFTTAVIPFGIAISLCHRRYVNVVVFTVISIILFGLTSHKTMVIMPFLSIGVFFLLSQRPSFLPILISFSALLLLVAIAAIFDSGMNPSSIWGSVETMFVRRALFVPAMIDYDYIEFFAGGDKYYWSTSKLSFGLLDIPYNETTPPMLIGMTYFGPGNSANTGFIGSGFAQAGLFGTFIYAVGVGLLIGFFQTCSRYMGIPLVITATIGLFSSMIQSTDFVTLFLTHGLVPALLILASMRDQAAPNRTAGRGPWRVASGAPILLTAKR